MPRELQASFGFMLYKGRDDEPELFCGFDAKQKPMFSPAKSANIQNDPTPMLFWYKPDALEAWARLEELGEKIELLQLVSGYSQFQR